MYETSLSKRDRSIPSRLGFLARLSSAKWIVARPVLMLSSILRGLV